MTRAFHAPRPLVFDALTRPELLRRWYGPVGWSLAVCEIDLRVGGAWRFVTRRPDGREIGQRGVNWALRAIGRRTLALNTAAPKVARRPAASEDATCRWAGKDALRELASPKVRSPLTRRAR